MAKYRDPDNMDLAEVEKELEALDATRIEGDPFDRKRARALMARRNYLIAEENASAHGLTVEQYTEAKAAHAEKDDGTPFVNTLREHRRNVVRGLQGVKAKPASVGAKAK